jgi:hypothetical protein
VTVTESPASESADPVEQAQQVCDAAGLTVDGVMAFCLLVSNGTIAALAQLPRPTLERIIQQGISAETVAKCNGTPETEDPDDLPAAWSV